MHIALDSVHVSPAQHGPLNPPQSVVVVVPLPVVVVVELVVVTVVDVVVVDVVAQPLAVQASQQLSRRPVQARPSRGGRQWAASRLIEQRVTPCRFVRQQVTAPARPQVERAAQRCTKPAHDGFCSVALATDAAQDTYVPCRAAVAQSHPDATAARAAATSLRSGSVVGSHAPDARVATRNTVNRTIVDRATGTSRWRSCRTR
jgi:hypothetical protein